MLARQYIGKGNYMKKHISNFLLLIAFLAITTACATSAHRLNPTDKKISKKEAGKIATTYLRTSEDEKIKEIAKTLRLTKPRNIRHYDSNYSVCFRYKEKGFNAWINPVHWVVTLNDKTGEILKVSSELHN